MSKLSGIHIAIMCLVGCMNWSAEGDFWCWKTTNCNISQHLLEEKSPKWSGKIKNGNGTSDLVFEKSKHLERLIARMWCCGYLPRDFPCLAALVDEADRKLFRSISHNPTHILHHYFIDKPESGHTLRTWAHNFVLPIKDVKNFVSHSTYATLKTHRSELLWPF